MNIIVNRRTLAQGLAEVCQVAGKNKTIQVLEYVMFVTKGDRIRLEASDGDNTIRKYIDAISSDEDGKFLVNAKSFTALLSKITTDEVKLSYSDSMLVVKYGKGKAKFATMPADEYPDTTKLDSEKEFMMSTSTLCQVLATCKDFCGNDDYRPMMKNIRLVVNGNRLNYAATDTHALITGNVEIAPNELVDEQFYVSPAVAVLILKAAKNCDTCKITIAQNKALFRIGDLLIYATPYSGKYPDINRVIPKQLGIDCRVNRAALLDAMQRTMIFCDVIGMVKFSIKPDSLTISAADVNYGRDNQESLDAVNTQPLVFGVNAPLFVTAVKATKGEDITLHLKDANSAFVIDDGDENRTILLMPMSLE